MNRRRDGEWTPGSLRSLPIVILIDKRQRGKIVDVAQSRADIGYNQKKSNGIEKAVRIEIRGLAVDTSAGETPVALRAPYVSPADNKKGLG